MAATDSFLLLLLLLLAFSLLISPSLSRSPSLSPQPEPKPEPKYATFVETSCNATTYPSLCQRTCLPFASDIKEDPRKLAAVALSATLSAAQSSAAVMAKVVEQSGNFTLYEVSAVKDCMDNIGDSMDDLKQSIDQINDLGSGSPESREMKFKISNIQTWMSAAISNENSCMDGIEERNKVSPYVNGKIKGAILGLIELTSNALSLCNHLQH